MRKVYWFVLTVSIVNMILSGIILQKHKDTSSNICPISNSVFKCDTVLNSSYASFFGIPVALIGLVSFGLVALIAWYGLVIGSALAEEILVVLLVLGSLGALRFLFIQAFVLEAFCPYCVTIDILLILAAALFIYKKKQRRGHVFNYKAFAL